MGNFSNIVITPAVRNSEDEKQNILDSLAVMRERMLTDSPVYAGVFIGGMEGVIDEYELLKKYSINKSLIYPIASTGAAACVIYDDLVERKQIDNTRFLTDYCYSSLFDDLLNKI